VVSLSFCDEYSASRTEKPTKTNKLLDNCYNCNDKEVKKKNK